MSDIAIRVENLGKRYRIGALQKRHDTLRDVIAAKFQRSHVSAAQRSNDELIWALRDVSFEVKRGEVVGVIGRNGAGKSTLLKILSRITEPSEGKADMYGRVASLLEVGTGFHGELSGRENIYLSGAIMGMRKAEIDRKFDEIVAFAEVEKFIDTPVKHYSSGMYVRLAFAVAAHLEPEILLVDEVLAVGDAAFQKKCLGKMGDVAREGRTVLVVSHNMFTISSLCASGILMEAGNSKCSGSIDEVVQEYLRGVSREIDHGVKTFKSDEVLPFRVNSMSTGDVQGNVKSVFPKSGSIVIRIEVEVRIPADDYLIALDVKALDEMLLFRTHNIERSETLRIMKKKGKFTLDCILPANLLPATTYRLGLITAIAGKRELQNAYPALEFDVIQDELLGNIFVGSRGLLTPECTWRVVEYAD